MKNTIRAFFYKPQHNDLVKLECTVYLFMPGQWKIFQIDLSHDDGRGSIPWVSLFLQFFFIGASISVKKENLDD